MAKGRREYRVHALSGDELSVTIVETRELEFPGRVVDVSLGGASVFIDRTMDPSYAKGDTVLLRLDSRYLGSPLVVQAQVRHRAEVRSGCIFGLDFCEWEVIARRLPPELVELFNQRRSCRIEPDPAEPIALRVEELRSGLGAEGTLKDISTTGLSFRVAPGAANPLSIGAEIRISFSLPGASAAIALPARIRHRESRGDKVLCGAEFGEDSAESFEAQRRAIASYITAQILEPLGVAVR